MPVRMLRKPTGGHQGNGAVLGQETEDFPGEASLRLRSEAPGGRGTGEARPSANPDAVVFLSPQLRILSSFQT